MNNNEYDQKNGPTIFMPSGVHTKPKPKTNPKPKLSLFFFYYHFFRASFRFWLSVYSAGQKHRWLISSGRLPPCITALAGLSLTFAMESLQAIQSSLRLTAEVENMMTAVERVVNYTKLDPEPGYGTSTAPPESWPQEGTLQFKNMSLAYAEDGPRVLKDITLSVGDKEKVGIVGRTGAGKSSVASALFRMPEPEGNIFVGGLDVATLGLQASRRAIAIISQSPVLFSGSLRRNLDPFSRFADIDLWAALEQVQLKALIEALPGQLEYNLRESGSNFSVGQRQLLCLARALLQKTKIIVMDEATASVDFKTDQLIQEVIRNMFSGCTVLTVAHRLNTIIDYDKVLVLDRGRVVEFDKPEALLGKSNGYFTEMVNHHNEAISE